MPDTPISAPLTEGCTAVVQEVRVSPYANDPRLHAGHRRRLRKRFLVGGAEVMASHELLELMLTYALPRADVNPLAHRLLERFCSLNGVLSASAEELQAVPGVGEQTACLLRLFSAVCAIRAAESTADVRCMDTVNKVAAYMRAFYKVMSVERVYLLLMDARLRLLDCCLLSEGTVNDSPVPIRRAAELCLYKHAAGAILVHNHPTGGSAPSAADLDMTRRAETAFNAIGVPLLEHIVLSEDGCTAILYSRKQEK